MSLLAKQLMSYLRASSAEIESDKSCRGCKAIPGTVTPHNCHVLIRIPSIADGPKSWPERVEEYPAITAVNTAIKATSQLSSIKVTAFDYTPEYKQSLSSPLSTTAYEAFIFPAGIHISNIQDIDTLSNTIINVLTQTDSSTLQLDDTTINCRILQDNEMALIICCHKSRDYRCGNIGPVLASKLTALGAFTILSSHIGGHAYAGNVICYCKGHPANGHWFGGLTYRSAEQFWKALSNVKEQSVDVCMNMFLNTHWRGKVGLSKDQQKVLFDTCCAKLGIVDIEDVQ